MGFFNIHIAIALKAAFNVFWKKLVHFQVKDLKKYLFVLSEYRTWQCGYFYLHLNTVFRSPNLLLTLFSVYFI